MAQTSTDRLTPSDLLLAAFILLDEFYSLRFAKLAILRLQ
jgi:hypothetical protein